MKNMSSRSLFQSALLLGALMLQSVAAQASLSTDLHALNTQTVSLKSYLASTDMAANDACARLVDMLLRACPDLRILASSREPLGVAGETAFRVPSLAIPDIHALPPLDEWLP